MNFGPHSKLEQPASRQSQNDMTIQTTLGTKASHCHSITPTKRGFNRLSKLQGSKPSQEYNTAETGLPQSHSYLSQPVLTDLGVN